MIKKNILIVTPQLSRLGGVSSFWNALLPELRMYDDIAINNLQIGGHGKNILGPVLDQWSFRKVIKKNVDLAFLNPSLGSRSFFRDALFAKQLIQKSLPFVVFFHGWDLDFEQKVDEKYSGFFLKTFGQAKIIFVLSEDFKNKILEWGYEGEVILETTNVDASLLDGFSINTKIESLKNITTIKILFLARLLKEKGVFETVEAFQNLCKKYENIELIIAGDGKDLDALKTLVAKDSKIIVAGYVEGKNKIDLFEQSHIYCFPTFYGEGLPTSVLEAMAFAMPIITTNMGGLKEFFKDKEMGYFVEPKDVKQLEEKLELLLNDRRNIISIGRHNAHYAKERLLSTVVTKRLYDCILEVLE